MDALLESERKATKESEHEHVTPWLINAPHLKRANLHSGDPSLAKLRWVSLSGGPRIHSRCLPALPAGSRGLMADVLDVLRRDPSIASSMRCTACLAREFANAFDSPLSLRRIAKNRRRSHHAIACACRGIGPRRMAHDIRGDFRKRSSGACARSSPGRQGRRRPTDNPRRFARLSGAQSIGSSWITTAATNRSKSACRAWAKHILAIADFADRRHDCDLLLDQTIGRKSEADRALHEPFVPGHCALLLGLEYALVRDQFTRRRTEAKELRDRTHEARRVLMSFGGTDAFGLTPRILPHSLRAIRRLSLMS